MRLSHADLQHSLLTPTPPRITWPEIPEPVDLAPTQPADPAPPEPVNMLALIHHAIHKEHAA